MEENRTENFDFNLYSEKITAWRRVRGTINQANCLLSRLRGFTAEKNKGGSVSQIPTSHPVISRWWPRRAILAAKPALRRSVTEGPVARGHQETLVQLPSSPQRFCLTVLGTLGSRPILHTFRHLTAAPKLRLSPPATGSACGEGQSAALPSEDGARGELSHLQRHRRYLRSAHETRSRLSSSSFQQLTVHWGLMAQLSEQNSTAWMMVSFPPIIFPSVTGEKVTVGWKMKFRVVDNKFQPIFQYHLSVMSDSSQWTCTYQKLGTQSPAQVQLPYALPWVNLWGLSLF